MFHINLDFVYPVGSIYITTDGNFNPNNGFGGTWSVFASGRTIVGVDTSQTEFNTVEKTGGSKYMQKHTHTLKCNFYDPLANSQGLFGQVYKGQLRQTGMTNRTNILEEGEGDSGNLQPYITVYMWKRIA